MVEGEAMLGIGEGTVLRLVIQGGDSVCGWNGFSMSGVL